MLKLWIEVLQVVSALGLINVWLFRSGMTTPYRGGDSQNLRDEFTAYGLPGWVYYTVGFLKLTAAIALVVGIWVHRLILPAAGITTLLMLGALAMHFKVKDPLIKSVPAFSMLIINAVIFFCYFDDISTVI